MNAAQREEHGKPCRKRKDPKVMKRQFNKLIKGIGQPPARARRGFGLVLAGMALALVPQSGRSGTEGETAHTSLARASATTVWSQIGARSGAEYKGDGLTVIPVP